MARRANWSLLLLVAFICPPAIAQQCVNLQGSSPDGLVSYLSGVVYAQSNMGCIAFAVNQLGNQRYEPAIPVLTKFLEFRWPPDARQKQRLFVLEREGSSIYPAANALELIGKNALPAVLNVMKSSSTSRQALEVATSIWMTIQKDQAPVAVALLKQAADNSKTPMERQRLGWAAYKAAEGWCSPSEKDQCKAAAQARYSN